MKTIGSVFLLSLLAAGFVYFSATELPPVVASHFAAGGAANGFMARGSYVAVMVTLTVGLPLLFAFLTSFVARLPPNRVSLPNGDYWLAPERRATTLAYLQWHGAMLGVLLALFLCIVHWLVLRANAVRPPLFPESAFLTVLILFVAAVGVWIGALFLRFRRPSCRR